MMEQRNRQDSNRYFLITPLILSIPDYPQELRMQFLWMNINQNILQLKMYHSSYPSRTEKVNR